MGDIRDQLNARRDALAPLEAQDRAMLTDRRVETDAYKRAVDRQREREHLEATLATFQLADTQQELVIAQRAATKAQQAATAEQVKANAAADKAKGKSEEMQFWGRRYLTNLLVGNAAGFVAVLTFMLKEDSPKFSQSAVIYALTCFGAGTLLGGVMPLLRMVEVSLAVEKDDEGVKPVRRWLSRFASDSNLNIVAAGVGSAMLLSGLMVTIGCARGYYAARGPEKPKESQVIVRVVQLPAPVTTPVVAAEKPANP